MALTNLRIGTRLGLGFATLLIFMACLTGTGLWHLRSVGELSDQIAVEGIQRSRAIVTWQAGIQLTNARILAAVKNADPVEQKYFQDLVATSIAKNSELQKDVERLVTDDAGKARLKTIAERRVVARATTAAIFKEKVAGNDVLARQMISDTLIPVTSAYLDELAQLAAQQDALINAMVAEVEAHGRNGRNILLALGCAALLAGVICAVLLTRS
ncbi:MAG: MCP four helix bundle domain-containing protein, partial [Sphingomonadaceae bacterium]